MSEAAFARTLETHPNRTKAVNRLLADVVDQPDLTQRLRELHEQDLLGDAAELEERGDRYQTE
jgi:hypothetical protein